MEKIIILILFIAISGVFLIPTPTPDVSPATTTIWSPAPPATPAPTPSPTTVPTPPPPPGGQCPPTGIHTIPHDHCQYFVTCINGNHFETRCQDGFLFDTVRGSCEPAGTVDCGDRTRP